MTVASDAWVAPGHNFQPMARHLVTRAAEHNAAIGGEVFAHINRVAGGGDRGPAQRDAKKKRERVRVMFERHVMAPAATMLGFHPTVEQTLAVSKPHRSGFEDATKLAYWGVVAQRISDVTEKF